MKRLFLTGASTVTIALFTSILAPSAEAADAQTTAAPAPKTTVGEVIVTAEKRSTRLESTPVAITALTAQVRDLQGIVSVQDITDVTPGFAYDSLLNRPYMRGIGRNTDNLATDSGVATYLDGVYNGANATTILQSDSLFVDRIDVMRGPQSTLYGRNSDGGAVNYISKRPTNDYEAEARVGYANYDKYFGEAVVSGPITDSLKFRLGGNYTSETGGYYKNLSGSPEGGSVAQGGNGTSYHAELQLQGNIGDKFDAWAKVATSDFDTSFHTTATLGPMNDSPFGIFAPSALYGLCATAGGSGGVNCGPNGFVGSYVTNSATPLNAISTNPSGSTLRDYAAAFHSTSKMHNDVILATTLTYHFPSADLKYTGGYQSYVYDLYFPSMGTNVGVQTSNIQSYQLQGPGTPGGLCLYVTHDPVGCASNLTINTGKSAYGFIENDTFYSHELNLTSTGNGPVQYVLGLYYYHEHYNQPLGVFNPGQTQLLAPANGLPNPQGCVVCYGTTLTSESYAGFGQVDWSITPTIKLTGGLRYTDDHKSGFEQIRLVSFDYVPGYGVATWGAYTPAIDITSLAPWPTVTYPGAGLPSYNLASGYETRSLDAHWNAVTGLANLSWTPDHDTLAYLRYSRGYKSGGFDSGQLIANPETKAELVDAVELGLKKVFGGVFQLNTALFYYNYSNDQAPLVFQPAYGGPISTLLFNIPTVRTYGFELESMWRPIDNLVLSFNYSYLNSTITNTGGNCFEDTSDPAALAPGANKNGCLLATGGNPQTQNLKGAAMPAATPNKVSLNAIYTFHFEPGDLALSGTYIWKDKTYASVFNRWYNQTPAYSQVNLRATWTDAKNRYSVIVFGDNVFNALGYDAAVGEPINTYPLVVYKNIGLTAPTTYGIEFQYRFH